MSITFFQGSFSAVGELWGVFPHEEVLVLLIHPINRPACGYPFLRGLRSSAVAYCTGVPFSFKASEILLGIRDTIALQVCGVRCYRLEVALLRKACKVAVVCL